MLNIVEGKIDIFFRNKPISKWDLCAGDALLIVSGGKITFFN